jgi:hypothetical protein
MIRPAAVAAASAAGCSSDAAAQLHGDGLPLQLMLTDHQGN